MPDASQGFNPTDPAFLENPFPFYALGRKHMPLAFNESAGVWLAFAYDDVQSVLKDNSTWSSAQVPMEGVPPGPPPTMLFSDPPRHTRLRGLVAQAFTPRMIDQLEPRIRRLADELLDPVASVGNADIVESLAYPLPVIVIAEILGIPSEDRARFKRWSDDVVRQLGQGVGPGEAPPPPEAAFEQMRAYFTSMAEDRRSTPRDDLITGLVAAEVEGSKLNSEELLQMLILLLVAGNETTTNLIGNAIQEFIVHPAQLQAVLDDPSLVPSAIEEVLRFSSPVQVTARRATRTVELHGKTIVQNQQVMTWLGSANRDEQFFERGEEFNVRRALSPRHLAFGLGPHFCMGAPLARLEARIAIESFLRRCKNFQRATSEPLPRVPTFVMRGVRSLPIVFDPE